MLDKLQLISLHLLKCSAGFLMNYLILHHQKFLINVQRYWRLFAQAKRKVKK